MIDAALLLPKMLARMGDNAELTEMAAKIAWRRVAGEGLRGHAVPITLSDKSLVVSVADAIWQKQLQTMSAELIFRINNLLQRNVVNKIEFRIDPRELGQGRVTRRSTSQASTPLPANVVSSATTIEDSDLREKFMKAAQNCISRRDSGHFAIRNPQSQT